MRVAGLDLSNTYCGVAVVADYHEGRPTLLRLGSVPGAGTAEAPKTARRVHELLAPTIVDRVSWERPPAQGTKGEHGRRLLDIGFGLGWICGLVIGPYELRGIACTNVTPGVWRETMLTCSTEWGVPASAPPDKPPARIVSKGAEVRSAGAAGVYVLLFACGHEVRVTGGLAALTRRVERPCQECESPGPRAPDALDWKSDEWKRIACALTAAHWPEPYNELVAAARGRAKTNPPDHRLAGVHDACEAAWIAVHGLVH